MAPSVFVPPRPSLGVPTRVRGPSQSRSCFYGQSRSRASEAPHFPPRPVTLESQTSPGSWLLAHVNLTFQRTRGKASWTCALGSGPPWGPCLWGACLSGALCPSLLGSQVRKGDAKGLNPRGDPGRGPASPLQEGPGPREGPGRLGLTTVSRPSGQPIPRVQYTAEETRTWGVVFRELCKLYPTHACREHLDNLPLLTQHCGYREDNVPQLQDVSAFLRGFTVRPVAGYLSPRDFLAGLAYRVFHCTQYVRHGSDPLYTPEPDTCHELLGHVPLLADPKFAQFSQEIGLASLGASDEDVQKLATCYFFTIEFGLCKQEGQLRAYGAGLLSSIGELKHALSDKACVKAFDPKTTCLQECLITTFQDAYFVSESFEEAKEKMRDFAKSITRPFSVHFNPYTQSIEILKDTRSIENVVQDLRGDLNTVCDALNKMNQYLGI
uniref:Tryptophan hydroxylase 2 n=1 Tax=Canis lupus dingo TaxID=286419 RepID=A0A8C0KTC0_CANLU